jgi:hypothetical protein
VSVNNSNAIKARWLASFKNIFFVRSFVVGLILLVVILAYFPFFFDRIEERDGYQMNDWLINRLPAFNLSYPIFSIIWFCAVLTITQAVKKPHFFLLFMWGFIVLSLSRIITISIVTLNPPKGLLPLIDPVTNIFYGGKFITKDLFYSGHTSTMFLMYLCVEKKWHKTITLIASILIGIMVLIQHVHYTIDVITAPIFTYGVYLIAKKIVNQ